MERIRVTKQRHDVLYQRQANIPGVVENRGNSETRVMESIGQQFLNWSVHQNHSEGLLKQTAGFPSRGSNSIRLQWDLRIYISNKFPGGTETTLQETLPKGTGKVAMLFINGPQH